MSALYHVFPPTIHPMVIHFTIALTYLAALAGLAGLIFRRDPLLPRAFLILLCLAILATIAAGIAGVISESYVTVPASVASTLHQHKQYGELTGVLLVISTAVQAFVQTRVRRVSVIAFVVCLAAVVTVSFAGFLGGGMVYDHGFGVHTGA